MKMLIQSLYIPKQQQQQQKNENFYVQTLLYIRYFEYISRALPYVLMQHHIGLCENVRLLFYVHTVGAFVATLLSYRRRIDIFHLRHFIFKLQWKDRIFFFLMLWI